MTGRRLAVIRPLATRRGPRSRAWYEACVRHALHNYANPRALRRNPLQGASAIASLAGAEFSDTWCPGVAALRQLVLRSVEDVLASASEADRAPLGVVLRGTMQGRTMRAIAADLSCGREWLHKTWWPEAVRAVTTVMLQRHLRVSDEPADEAPPRPAVLRPAG